MKTAVGGGGGRTWQWLVGQVVGLSALYVRHGRLRTTVTILLLPVSSNI